MWRRRVRRSQPWWGCHLVLRLRIVVVVVGVKCHWKRQSGCRRVLIPVVESFVGVCALAVVLLELLEVGLDHGVDLLVGRLVEVVYV